MSVCVMHGFLSSVLLKLYHGNHFAVPEFHDAEGAWTGSVRFITWWSVVDKAYGPNHWSRLQCCSYLFLPTKRATFSMDISSAPNTIDHFIYHQLRGLESSPTAVIRAVLVAAMAEPFNGCSGLPAWMVSHDAKSHHVIADYLWWSHHSCRLYPQSPWKFGFTRVVSDSICIVGGYILIPPGCIASFAGWIHIFAGSIRFYPKVMSLSCLVTSPISRTNHSSR